MQVGEWANSNQGQSNAPTDPSDRMGMLLFAATHIQELSTEIDDGQFHSTPKGATMVRGKLVSSEQKRKIYQAQSIRRYSEGHQVQQQIKDINASPNIPRKRTVNILNNLDRKDILFNIYCNHFCLGERIVGPKNVQQLWNHMFNNMAATK